MREFEPPRQIENKKYEVIKVCNKYTSRLCSINFQIFNPSRRIKLNIFVQTIALSYDNKQKNPYSG